MKIRSKISLVSLLVLTTIYSSSANSNDLKSGLAESANKFLSPALSKLFENDYEEAPNWLKRLEIEHQLNEDGKPQFGITTIQPIFEAKNDFLFNQTRIAYGDSGRLTTNLGLGYRHLTEDENIFYGTNYFYDFQGPYGHQRSGLGAELRSASFEVNSNYYLPHTGWRDVDTIYEEKALEGFDTELGFQTPYMPWAWWFAKGYQYSSEINKSENITGGQYSLRLRPFENIDIEAGYNNSNETKPENFVALRYRIGFDDPQTITKKRSMFSNTAFEYGSSMREKIYDRVRRSNNITVERRVKGGGGGSGGTATVVVSVGS
ncbi:MAG: inverse autotransporter beta domain-containing protein [Rickettsiales bacterium]|nr:inverse autotransporter beta domain-containing protein [Rickettsiales bacterium]